MVMDGVDEATPEQITEWLKTSPWGRDAFQCEDNDQPDHLVAILRYMGGITGTFTMTAFEEGRHHLGNYSFGAMQRLFSDQPTVMIASYTRKVCNRILETAGTLDLDYIIEVRGMDTQRTVFSLSIDPLALVPNGFEGDAAEESEL